MSTERAASCGVEAILSAYDGMCDDVPFYSVWHNKNDKAFQWNKDDLDGGREYLQTFLDGMQRAGESALYYLKIHPAYEAIYGKSSPVICSLPIRANALPNSQINGTGVYDFNAYRQMQDKIAALEKQIQELETEEQDEGNPILNQISGILNNEHVAPVIGKILETIMQRYLPGATPAASHNSAMIAGINDGSHIAEKSDDGQGKMVQYDDAYWIRVNNALGRLQTHVDLASGLEKLADMAEQNPAMFEMVKKFL